VHVHVHTPIVLIGMGAEAHMHMHIAHTCPSACAWIVCRWFSLGGERALGRGRGSAMVSEDEARERGARMYTSPEVSAELQ